MDACVSPELRLMLDHRRRLIENVATRQNRSPQRSPRPLRSRRSGRRGRLRSVSARKRDHPGLPSSRKRDDGRHATRLDFPKGLKTPEVASDSTASFVFDSVEELPPSTSSTPTCQGRALCRGFCDDCTPRVGGRGFGEHAGVDGSDDRDGFSRAFDVPGGRSVLQSRRRRSADDRHLVRSLLREVVLGSQAKSVWFVPDGGSGACLESKSRHSTSEWLCRSFLRGRRKKLAAGSVPQRVHHVFEDHGDTAGDVGSGHAGNRPDRGDVLLIQFQKAVEQSQRHSPRRVLFSCRRPLLPITRMG